MLQGVLARASANEDSSDGSSNVSGEAGITQLDMIEQLVNFLQEDHR